MEPTFDMTDANGTVIGEYFPLRFSESRAAPSVAAQIATEALNRLSNTVQTKKHWEKAGELRISVKDAGNVERTGRTSFDILKSRLMAERRWPEDLPPPPLSWLDRTLSIGMRFHAPGNQPEPPSLAIGVSTEMGKDFPLTPSLDREGIALASMQIHLQKKILATRERLVARSHVMMSFDEQWMDDLLNYFNSCVSVVETTLHQIYYKGKYDHKAMGWQFDEKRIGPPTTGRFLDKLRWVHAITGKELDTITSERNAFKTLKHVRNHLNHFDPPVFACTIEDVAGWLNCTTEIAKLLWKIRTRVSAGLTSTLVALLLAPRVDFVPHSPTRRRVPQPPKSGYASCIWPTPANDD